MWEEFSEEAHAEMADELCCQSMQDGGHDQVKVRYATKSIHRKEGTLANNFKYSRVNLVFGSLMHAAYNQ